jgi:hypothetical protein
MMALRVLKPLPLRALGIAAIGMGVFIVESFAASRPPAIVGLVLVAAGIALLAAVGERHVSVRHVGLFAIVAGASLAAWAGVVLVGMTLFDLHPGRHLLVLLGVGAAGTLAGAYLLRRG